MPRSYLPTRPRERNTGWDSASTPSVAPTFHRLFVTQVWIRIDLAMTIEPCGHSGNSQLRSPTTATVFEFSGGDPSLVAITVQHNLAQLHLESERTGHAIKRPVSIRAERRELSVSLMDEDMVRLPQPELRDSLPPVSRKWFIDASQKVTASRNSCSDHDSMKRLPAVPIEV